MFEADVVIIRQLYCAAQVKTLIKREIVKDYNKIAIWILNFYFKQCCVYDTGDMQGDLYGMLNEMAKKNIK